MNRIRNTGSYHKRFIYILLISFTLEVWRNILRRHENNEWHVKVMRNGGEGEAIVGVHHQEGWASRKREEIPWVKATVLLVK